jgi:hypothetical protein
MTLNVDDALRRDWHRAVPREIEETVRLHPTERANPVTYEPHDILEPQELFTYLSPEVRRFAIAMEARFHLVAQPDEPNQTRPRRVYNLLLANLGRLLEAFSHPAVTDRLLRPLPLNHVDRNPRRVVRVLEEAATIASYCLLIANQCGALSDVE